MDEGPDSCEFDLNQVKKNLLSELNAESPKKSNDEMPPPPAPETEVSTERMPVYLRIRPLNSDEVDRSEDQGCTVVTCPTKIDMIAPKDSKTFQHSTHGTGKVVNSFTFSHIYDQSTTQKKLFDETMFPIMKDFVDGQNVLVFSYGVTSSGKTYTLQGTPSEPGLIPRSLEVLFNSVQDKQYERADLQPHMYCEVRRLGAKDLSYADKFKAMVLNVASKGNSDSTELYSSNDSLASLSSMGESVADCSDEMTDLSSISTDVQGHVKFSLWVSFAEIYNEQIHDLLEPLTKTSSSKRRVYTMREDKHGNPYIKDLRHIQVSSVDEAIKVFKFGQRNLQYACTKLNENSSRSHCLFNIKMIRVADKENPQIARMSQLSFCDLAGSERYRRTQNTGDRLKEAANINTSLLTLGRCIQLLRQNQLTSKQGKDKVLPPFRESKLTRLLQTFFCGKGKACMIVNVSPAASSFDENLHTLKFSAIAKQVEFYAEKPEPLPKPQKEIPKFEDNNDLPESRHTIAWATEDQLQEGDRMERVAESGSENEEDEDELERYKEAVEKLKSVLLQTKKELHLERKAKNHLESKLRNEICEEMMQQITRIESQYEQDLEEQRQRYEDAADKKISMMTAAIHKSVKRKRYELEEDVKENMVSKSVYDAQMIKLERQTAEMETLNCQMDSLKRENENLKSELDAVLKKTVNSKPELTTSSTVTCNVSSQADPQDDGMLYHEDITSNEIFITVSKKLEDASEEILVKDAEIKELNQNLEEAGEAFAEKEKTIAEQNAKISAMEYERNEMQARLLTLEQQLEDNADQLEQIAGLKNQLTDLKVQHDEELSHLKKQHDKEVKELELEVVAVSRGLQSTDKEKEMAENQLASRIQEYERLMSEMDRLKESLSNLTDKAATSQEMEVKCNVLTQNLKVVQDQLRRRSVELQGDMGTVQTQLFSTKKELDRVKREREKAERLLNDCEHQLQIARSDNSKCQQELEELKKLHEDLKTDSNERSDELFSANEKVVSLESQISDVRTQKENLDGEVQNLRELLQKSEAEASTLESTIYQLRKKINHFDENSAAEAEKLKSELGSVTRDKVQLASKLSESDSEKFRIDSELKASLEKICKLEETVKDLRNEKDGLNESSRQQQEKVVELEHELEKVKDSAAGHKLCNDNLTKQINDHLLELTEAKEKLIAFEESIREKENRIDDLKIEKRDLEKKRQEENNSDSEELKKLRVQVTEKDSEVGQLYDEIATLQAALNDANKKCEQLSALANKVKEINDRLDHQRLLHETATERIKVLSEENLKLKEYQKDETENKKLQEQVDMLKEDVVNKETKAESLSLILEARQTEWDRKETAYESAKIELEQVKDTEKQLRAENLQLQQELTSQGKELSSLEYKMATSSSESLSREKSLRDQISEMEAQLRKRRQHENDVSMTTVSCTANAEDKDKLIDELKSALNEQEMTMKIQDELIESKEADMKNLTEEMNNLQRRQQLSSDFEHERSSLNHQILQLKHEKEVLQEMQVTMETQVNTLNQKISRLELDIKNFSTESKQLRDQIKYRDDNVKHEDVNFKQSDTTKEAAVSDVDQRNNITYPTQQPQRDDDQEIQLHTDAGQASNIGHDGDGFDTPALKQTCLSRQLRVKLKRLEQDASNRLSDVFKEPEFANDNELTGSTMELDVTPISAKKRTTRKDSRNQTKTGSLKGRNKRLEEVVGSSSSSSTSPELKSHPRGSRSTSKKLLRHLSPRKSEKRRQAENKEPPADLETTASLEKTKRKRKLYRVDDNTLTSPTQEPVTSDTKPKSSSNVHSIVTRNLRNLQMK